MHAGVGVSAAVIDAPQVKREKQTRMDHVRGGYKIYSQ